MVKSKKKVLFVLLQVNRGGAETIVFELAKNLSGEKFEIYLAYFSGGALVEAFRNICKGVYQIDKKPGFDITAILKLNRIIRGNNIDFVNAHHYSAFFYAFFANIGRSNTQILYTEHSVAELERFSTFYEHISNIMFYRTKSIIAVSNDIAKAFKEKFPAHKKRVVFIPNGVDIKKFSDKRKFSSQCKNALGFEQNATLIGCVANFRHVKNHVCLVKAFKRVHQKYPTAKLILIGTGFGADEENSENDIKRTINDLALNQHVIFTGYRDDVPELLGNLDLFCLPSLSEGMPVALIEAMAARIPVVGSNVRGIREVISHKVNGMLFEVNDERALSEIIMILLNNKKLSMELSERAFLYVRERHSLSNWINNFEALLNQSENAIHHE